MDRLTIRNRDGSVSQPIDLKWDEALDRLAAYEDIGLAPETLSEILDGISDWLEAHQNNRLIVLPCKVGDTVYWIREKAILEVYIQWFETNAYGWCACGTYPPLSTPTFRFTDFGKSVFLTRDEAEKALERSKNNDEH